MAEERRADAKRRSSEIDLNCLEDVRWWVDQNRKPALRILDLIEASCAKPFSGYRQAGIIEEPRRRTWSRRITEEQRLVDVVLDDRVVFVQAPFHY